MMVHKGRGVNRLLLSVLAGLGTFAEATAAGGGGMVQLHREAGDLAITVFTSPSPLVAGPVDMSVLVQNRNGLQPVVDADVFLYLRESSTGAEFEAHATRQNAQNKPLYAAPLMLSKPGKWELGVTVERNGQLTGVGGLLEVAAPPGGKGSYTAHIVFSLLASVLYLPALFAVAVSGPAFPVGPCSSGLSSGD
jgi:hypothetical protein